MLDVPPLPLGSEVAVFPDFLKMPMVGVLLQYTRAVVTSREASSIVSPGGSNNSKEAQQKDGPA